MLHSMRERGEGRGERAGDGELLGRLKYMEREILIEFMLNVCLCKCSYLYPVPNAT